LDLVSAVILDENVFGNGRKERPFTTAAPFCLRDYAVEKQNEALVIACLMGKTI
jgi:hypothetical protein